MLFSVYTLGCKLNQLETEAITDSFCREGFSLIPWDRSSSEPGSKEPGIFLINTCTVTSMAEQKARRLIRKILREHPRACLIVTGCYAQMEKDALAVLGEDSSERFFVIPGEKKDRILDLPRFLAGSPGGGEDVNALPELISSWFGLNCGESTGDGVFRYRPKVFSSHSRAFLKIQDGCDRRCAYCRVSLARGKSRSLGAKEALETLITLERSGFAEVVLTGVNISQYRDAGGCGFAGMGLPGLLEFLLEGTEKIRLRLSSIEPDGLTDEFIRVLANERIRPHFHLSLQSGSADILAKMGRPYTREDIETAVARLRKVKKDPFLACDIIAGFPGETYSEFEETRELCERTGFAWIHAFPFSPRPGTAAFGFSGRVSERDTAKRVRLLMALARKGRREYIRHWEGKEVEAVVEAGENLPNGLVPGVSENYLKLCINCGGEPAPVPGSIIRCRILSNNSSSHFDAAAEGVEYTPVQPFCYTETR